MSVVVSLEDVEGEVNGAIDEGAVLIFYHYGFRQFRHLLSRDNDVYHGELRQLRSHCREGVITSVTAGNALSLNITLYPLEIEYRGDVTCAQYFLLCRDGLMEHMYKVPYLYRDEQARDSAVAFLLPHVRSSAPGSS